MAVRSKKAEENMKLLTEKWKSFVHSPEGLWVASGGCMCPWVTSGGYGLPWGSHVTSGAAGGLGGL
jgi:hypothetical protein